MTVDWGWILALYLSGVITVGFLMVAICSVWEDLSRSGAVIVTVCWPIMPPFIVIAGVWEWVKGEG
ncbi:MAG: hypothetical protein AAF661_15175 [Pseudomonadota bacterium]